MTEYKTFTKEPKKYFYVWLIPVLLLFLVALPFDWSYGMYTYLKLVVTVSSILFIYAYSGTNENKSDVWKVLFVLVVLLYNPVFPVDLNDKTCWFMFNFLTIGLFATNFIMSPQILDQVKLKIKKKDKDED